MQSRWRWGSLVGGHTPRLRSVGRWLFPRVSVLVWKWVSIEALGRAAASGAIHKLQERQTDAAENEFPPVEIRNWTGFGSDDGNAHFQICDWWRNSNRALNKKYGCSERGRREEKGRRRWWHRKFGLLEREWTWPSLCQAQCYILSI